MPRAGEIGLFTAGDKAGSPGLWLKHKDVKAAWLAELVQGLSPVRGGARWTPLPPPALLEGPAASTQPAARDDLSAPKHIRFLFRWNVKGVRPKSMVTGFEVHL